MSGFADYPTYPHLARLMPMTADFEPCPVYEVERAKRDFNWDVDNHVARFTYLPLVGEPELEHDPFNDPDPYGPWAVWPGMHPEYGR